MGILGIGTKYAETYIAVKYRVKDKMGTMCGGAMYVWDYAFRRNKKTGKLESKGPWWSKVGAMAFAIFAMVATLGIGSSVQASAISESVSYYFPLTPQWIFAIVIVAISGLTIFGGVKAISKICEGLVPFMTVAYILGTIVLICVNGEHFVDAITMIFRCAFTPEAAFGGAVGSGLAAALQYGMARGLFSNESGLGTAPIVASAAATKNPARQSLVAMTGAF